MEGGSENVETAANLEYSPRKTCPLKMKMLFQNIDCFRIQTFSRIIVTNVSVIFVMKNKIREIDWVYSCSYIDKHK